MKVIRPALWMLILLSSASIAPAAGLGAGHHSHSPGFSNRANAWHPTHIIRAATGAALIRLAATEHVHDMIAAFTEEIAGLCEL